MRVLAKAFSVVGIVAAVALTASAADARPVNTTRIGGAHASVSAPLAYGSVPYDAGGVAFPNGHGGTSGGSPDFQLMR
jgi:hypothetical protein